MRTGAKSDSRGQNQALRKPDGQKHQSWMGFSPVTSYKLPVTWIYGARKRTRTSTPLRELAPEASASANSAIRAHLRVLRGKLIVPARGGVCQRTAASGPRHRRLHSEAAQTRCTGRG